MLFFASKLYLCCIKGFIAVKIDNSPIPPGSVCNYGQGSHEERKKEEGDEDGLHLSRLACSLRRLAVLC